MSQAPFKGQLTSVILTKFGYPITDKPDKKNSLDIKPQVAEINMYQSIYEPVMRAELVVSDTIGLFVNFPLSGEEIVKVTYEIEGDSVTKELFYVIEDVSDIIMSDDGRSMVYTINLVTVEALANSLRSVQHCYHGTSDDAVKQLFTTYIEEPLKKLVPSYRPRPFIGVSSNSETAKTIIIPNIPPFAAISMISEYHQPLSDDRFSYMFYQNSSGFHYTPLQNLFLQSHTGANRHKAYNKRYKYISDEIEGSEKYDNDGRTITALTYNKRHSTLQKIAMGYLQNNLVEINMAQKAYFTKKWSISDVKTIDKNPLNTAAYSNSIPVNEDNETANRVKYIINNQKENDISYPVSDIRERWGKDLAAKLALSQIDITVSVPGTYEFEAGELFYLEIPEGHGFNIISEDDLISGYFLITEVVQTISQSGNFATSFRLNKDSYRTSIDRESRY